MFKRVEKDANSETPCKSGKLDNNITQPRTMSKNIRCDEAPCAHSDVDPVAGESSSLGSASDKPDLAQKLSL